MAKLSILLLLASLCATAGCQPARNPADAQGAVVFEGRLSREFLPTEGQTLLYAQLRIGPGQIPEPSRSGVNLALVIDTSGSMEGEGIAKAKEAAKRLIETLADGDRLALVSFDTNVEVLLESTEIDADDRADVVAAVDRLKAEGTTDLYSGLQAGLDEVRKHLDQGGINGVVLLGDGLPNDATGIEDLARGAGGEQIRITSLGFGIDYNEALMAAIAQQSGGRFHYIAESKQVAAFFHDEVLRMQRVYAKNMQLDLVLGPEVDHQLLGRELAPGQRRISVPLGDLSQRESVEVMLRLKVPGRAEGAAIEILDARLSYVAPSFDDLAAEQRVYLGAHATDDETRLAKIDRALEHAGALAEAAHATLVSVAQARRGQRSEAEQSIDFAIERLTVQAKQDQAKPRQSKELSARADELRILRKTLPAPQPEPAAAEYNEEMAAPAMAEPMPEPSPEEQRQMKSTHDAAAQSFAPHE